ncbi:SGNH/GDSL hydrolase family protein [Prauserella oleivorans]
MAEQLGVTDLTDVSCSGATTRDLTGPQRTSDGTNPPQLDAVGPDTTLVTLGIGGNDVGFVQLAARCAGSGQEAGSCVAGADLATAIEDTADRIGAAVRQIRERAPRARVVVVGYPTVLPADPGACRPELPYAPADVSALRQSLLRLNEVLAQQATVHGADYADSAALSRGHGICAAQEERWVEGLRSTTGAAPLHPTARGERAMADAVLAAVR